MSKHIITEDVFVKCPYCNKEAKILHWKHLKMHDKKLDDVLKEFPGRATITREDYDKKCATSKTGTVASKQTHNEKRKVKCIHCNTEIEIRKNESIKQACKSCLDKGLNNPDGRTKEHANEAREKTLIKTYGDDVTNAAHVPGVTEKKIETNKERYGGIGYSSSYAHKCRKSTEDIFGNENVMKTEEGLERFKKYFKDKYGDQITNPMQILEIAKQASESMKKHYKENGHHLKDKTYEEIHGPEKAKELKEQKRISGAEGFRKVKDQFTSAPQKELFELVKEIYPKAELEYESRSYFIDIAVPEEMLCIEYDGSYWHNKEHDEIRDKLLSSFGWKVIRFVDKIPTKEELLKKIEKVL